MMGFPQHEFPITRLLIETGDELRSNDMVVRPSADNGHHGLPVEIGSNSKAILDASQPFSPLDVARFCYEGRCSHPVSTLSITADGTAQLARPCLKLLLLGA